MSSRRGRRAANRQVSPVARRALTPSPPRLNQPQVIPSHVQFARAPPLAPVVHSVQHIPIVNVAVFDGSGDVHEFMNHCCTLNARRVA
jgi:hypothetical protein